MFDIYIYPIILFAALAVISGVLLTVASKVFAVEVDERVDAVKEVLPQINCGACGYSGCEDYANAVINGEVTNLCKPGGDETSKKISEIMGSGYLDVTEEVAFVHCNGNCKATSDKFEFEGMPSCSAANRFYNGKGVCASACLGYGDCVAVCAYDAICMVDGIAVIDPERCTACGLCVKQCPKLLITMKPETNIVSVACSSKDSGKVTRQLCSNGCIACKICERKCEYDAIHVIDNRAIIDSDKCTNCGVCVQVCPVKCIHMRETVQA